MLKFFSRLFNGRRTRDKATLLALLSSTKYTFRTLGRLMRAIGSTDANYTIGLLTELGARKAYRGELYALTSRVGVKFRRKERVTDYSGADHYSDETDDDFVDDNDFEDKYDDSE